jgi:hypothetical protein
VNTKFYQYSILKYRPSLLLDEQVNIGLLFVFVEEKRVEFIFPTHLSRLNALYPHSNLGLIKAHLKGFKKKATDLSSKSIYFNDLENVLIETDFLQPDSNSFYFTEFKTGTYQQPEAIIEYYRTQFFAIYDENETAERQYDAFLSKKFDKALRLKSKEKAHLFQRDYVVGKGKVAFKFDYGWQNGKVNVIKFLNFNLKDEDSIVDKSSKWYGKTTLLKEEGSAENICFDFFVARPKERNHYPHYDAALDVLERITADKRIYEEDRHEEYLEQAIEEVKILV